ncbi:cysteine-rich receptor-like protein kinase, partial [Trifolium pratense]
MLSFTSFSKLSYRQKSRSTWLREGTCFHGSINRSSKENEMLYLEMNSNRVAGIDAIFEHFKTQFHAKRGNRPVPERFNFKRIEAEVNAALIDVFSEEEVRNAVWDCESLENPGPDGVNFEFVKEFWEDIKVDFLRVMTEFHTNGRLVKGVNCSFVVLVPKKYNPVGVSDFRRVSLVGCIYKVISKVLANRLERVIGLVISKPQSIFVGGREIMDGVRIANEVVDEAKRKKKEVIMFKLNYEKAYYSIDWKYLDYVMEKMGFDVRWREWISECLKAASISALVNGSPIEEFEMGCGLRQEDPLSPFLFLIAIESFNLMMRKIVELGQFSGFRFEGNDEQISHLQYADDILIIGDKSESNIFAIKSIIYLFELMAGVRCYLYKSPLVGINISPTWLEEAASRLHCKIGSLPFTYLGLPIGENPRKSSMWQTVLDAVRDRLSGWKNKHLSIGGRAVIIKSLLSGLLVYFLSS